MKKKTLKKIFTFLLTGVTAFGISATAFAADSSVTFKDGKLIVFEPGSEYTTTDLFDNFKGLMPGDVRLEEITVENQAKDYDYVKVYMKAILHDDEKNPISPNVLAALTEDERRGALTELEYMHDFLAQLTLKVESDGKLIYQGSPNELDGLKDPVYIGEFKKGENGRLNAQLEAPIELGNEYMNRIGEVDWVFLFEGVNNPIPDKPKTGDENNITIWLTLLSLSAVLGAAMLIKTKTNKYKA